MISGFSHSCIDVGSVTLSVHRAGTGVPLLLLHGYPQNHHCWSKVAPTFAKHFDVIIPDLRGYGDSDAPTDYAAHLTYSKRQMAGDLVGLLDALGLERAHVLGHDRGGRVAYRFALDHPDRLDRLGIIEILPTSDYWRNWTAELAMKAYHWTFLAQPSPLPERMIAADAAAYVDWTLASWTMDKTLSAFAPEALESYRRQACDPAHLQAMCADYRAGATIDRALDEADQASGNTIAAKLHFLWAKSGFPAQSRDPLATWRAWARDVTGTSCDSGHFIMEENPAAVLDSFVPFFRGR